MVDALSATIRSSLAAQQLPHGLFVGDRAGSARGDPGSMAGQCRLNLGLFQDLGRGMALHRSEPAQFGQRDDGRGLTTKMNDLERLIALGTVCRLRTHNHTPGLG